MRLLFTFATFLSFLLSGCGFSLRGSAIPLPERFTNTYFKEDLNNHSDFESKLKRQIELSGGHLVSEEISNVSVQVTPVERMSRQVALSDNGYAKEYEFTYSVIATVVDAKTGAQLGSRQVTSIQNLQLDELYVLSGEEESGTTRRIAELDLAHKIMQYLKSL